MQKSDWRPLFTSREIIGKPKTWTMERAREGRMDNQLGMASDETVDVEAVERYYAEL